MDSRAASPSARRQRRAGQAHDEAAPGRSWLRSPPRGTPWPPRASSIPLLSRHALAVRRYPRIAVNHWVILHQISAGAKAVEIGVNDGRRIQQLREHQAADDAVAERLAIPWLETSKDCDPRRGEAGP